MKTKSVFFILLLFAGFLFLNSCGDKKTSEVIFCESVDKDMNAVKPGESFDRGSIYAKLACKDDFNVNSIKLTLYEVDGSSEKVMDSFEQTVSPEWNVYAIPFYVTKPGIYKVEFSTLDGKSLGSGKVTITKI